MDVGDLTGDGKADLIAVEAESGGSYHYMLGTSSGSGVSSWTPVQSRDAPCDGNAGRRLHRRRQSRHRRG